MENTTKRTKRDYFLALITLAETGTMDVDADELKAFAQNEIDLLDKKAMKAKEASAKKKAEGDALRDAVYAVMSDTEFEPIADIVAKLDGDDITVAKVAYRLNALLKAGLAEKSDVSIPGADGGKARKCVAYRKMEG